jgi:hypothetical protein
MEFATSGSVRTLIAEKVGNKEVTLISAHIDIKGSNGFL